MTRVLHTADILAVCRTRVTFNISGLTSFCIPSCLFRIFLPRLDFAMFARLAAARLWTSCGPSVMRFIRIRTPKERKMKTLILRTDLHACLVVQVRRIALIIQTIPNGDDQ